MGNNASSNLILESIDEYLNKGYSFCADTNFFMECPDVISLLKMEKVLISRVAFNELDHGKSFKDDATEEEKEKAYKYRRGLEAMDDVGAEVAPEAPSTYIKSKNLSFSNDDKIIASYLKHMEDTEENIIFLTLDRGARAVARTVGLPFADFSISEYFELRKKKFRPTSKNGKQSTLKNRNQPKQKRGFFGTIGHLIGSLFVGVKALINIFFILLFAMIIFLVVAEFMEDSNYVKEFSAIEGDQTLLTLEVTDASNEEEDNTYEIRFDLLNKTAQEIAIKGYDDQNDLQRLSEYEEAKKTQTEGMSPILLRGEPTVKSYGIKVFYKDGTDELLHYPNVIQPREKFEVVVSSNGQLEDIEKIEVNFGVVEEDEIHTLTINPE